MSDPILVTSLSLQPDTEFSSDNQSINQQQVPKLQSKYWKVAQLYPALGQRQPKKQ